jgi:hypothetical protein
MRMMPVQQQQMSHVFSLSVNHDRRKHISVFFVLWHQFLATRVRGVVRRALASSTLHVLTCYRQTVFEFFVFVFVLFPLNFPLLH